MKQDDCSSRPIAFKVDQGRLKDQEQIEQQGSPDETAFSATFPSSQVCDYGLFNDVVPQEEVGRHDVGCIPPIVPVPQSDLRVATYQIIYYCRVSQDSFLRPVILSTFYAGMRDQRKVKHSSKFQGTVYLQW